MELENWFYATYIIFSILNNNYIDLMCFETTNIIKSSYFNFFEFGIEKIFYSVFLNDENTFIFFYGGTYNLPIGIFYPEKNIFYNLVFGNFGGSYNKLNEIINQFILRPEYLNNEYKIKSDLKKINVVFFGNNFQPGHYLWNEVSGINILIQTKLINNIDILVVGDWDIYNFSEIIKKNSKCKILSYTEFINSEFVTYNKLYSMIGDGFIDNETKKMIINNVNHIKIPNNKFKLLINLKLDRRIMIDTIENYIKIINRLIKNNIIESDNLFLIFDGLYLNNTNGSKIYYDLYSLKYLDGVQKIINNIQSNIEYKSLIGLPSSEIIKYYNDIDYFIGNDGSNVDILKWIFNKNGCIYASKEYNILQSLNKFYIEDIKEYNIIYGDKINNDEDTPIANFYINFENIYNEISYYILSNK